VFIEPIHAVQRVQVQIGEVSFFLSVSRSPRFD
jgi:hypothetical protein